MNHINICSECSTYTIKTQCSCGKATVLAIPPKYSPEDKYGKYRRQIKKAELIEKGIL